MIILNVFLPILIILLSGMFCGWLDIKKERTDAPLYWFIGLITGIIIAIIWILVIYFNN